MNFRDGSDPIPGGVTNFEKHERDVHNELPITWAVEYRHASQKSEHGQVQLYQVAVSASGKISPVRSHAKASTTLAK